jgi:hypothetical protein
MKITGTFEGIWKDGLEGDAQKAGVRDGDLHRVRARLKALFIRAGWATPEGNVDFVSEEDAANALIAARRELDTVASKVAHEGRVTRSVAGSSPTKSQVLSAAMRSEQQMATLHSSPQNEVSGSFAPRMGQTGDHCPRCSSAMEPVRLANQRAALYCTRDRVVIPMSPDTQIR